MEKKVSKPSLVNDSFKTFNILNIGLEAMNMKGESEFTERSNDKDVTNTTTSTELPPGMSKPCMI